jgi:hypothetical protein
VTSSLLDSSPGFELSASKYYGTLLKRWTDEVYELLQESSYSDISERLYNSDSEINVKILPCGDQGVRYNEGKVTAI